MPLAEGSYLAMSSRGETNVQGPGGLDEAPAGLDLVGEITVLEALLQREQLVGQGDAATRSSLVHEEANRNLRLVDVVEGVYHVDEA